MRGYVELAALLITGLFLGAAAAEAEQDTSQPTPVVRSSWRTPGGPALSWCSRLQRCRGGMF